MLLIYFLMLVLAVQFLPIKSISNNFNSFSLTEDTEDFSAEKKETDKGEKEFEAKKFDYQGNPNIEDLPYFKIKKLMHFSHNSSFYSRAFDDTPTPPPLFRF